MSTHCVVLQPPFLPQGFGHKPPCFLMTMCPITGEPEAAAPPSRAGGWEGATGAPPPPPPEPLPKLRALARAPSPLLRWQLPQLLFAYSGVLRLFNGDYRVDPLVRCIPGRGRPRVACERAMARV